MKGIILLLLILTVSIIYLDAFLPSPQSHHATKRATFTSKSTPVTTTSTVFRSSTDDGATSANGDSKPTVFTHSDILWKVRPPPETPWFRRLWLRFAANTIRLDAMLKKEDPPLVLCPKGGQAVLEAYIRPDDSSSYQKIGRFGFSTERGPPAPPIQESVTDLYGLDSTMMAGVAAIIYMFVEPDYRKRDLGGLALEVISLIHAIQNCDFTVLVVDDDGSGKLVDWYERKGYKKAPKLQALMGSPDGVNGLTMMKPTEQTLPLDCHIQWW